MGFFADPEVCEAKNNWTILWHRSPERHWYYPDGTDTLKKVMIAVSAIDLKTRAIKLKLRISNYKNWRFTFCLVPAKSDCLGFISNHLRYSVM